MAGPLRIEFPGAFYHVTSTNCAVSVPREAARWGVWRETATENMSREAVVKQW